MGTIINNFQPDTYISNVEMCYDGAKRDYEQKCALFNAKQADFVIKTAKHNKLKTYKEKLQATVDLASDTFSELKKVELILCNELKECIDLDLKTIRFLLCKVRAISEHLEHYYSCCVKDLNTRINNINDPELIKSNGIVAALQKLEEEYKIALDKAHIALTAALDTLKCIYLIHYKVIVPADDDLLDCPHNNSGIEPSKDKWGEELDNDPCSGLDDDACCSEEEMAVRMSCDDEEVICSEEDENNPCKDKCENCDKQYQDSVKDNIVKMTEFFNYVFEGEDNKGFYNYHTCISKKETFASCQKGHAEEKLSKAKQCKALAKSRMDSLKSAWDAAKAAKEC